MEEDMILEVARWAREAEAAVVAKFAALQAGEAFTTEEESQDEDHH